MFYRVQRRLVEIHSSWECSRLWCAPIPKHLLVTHLQTLTTAENANMSYCRYYHLAFVGGTHLRKSPPYRLLKNHAKQTKCRHWISRQRLQQACTLHCVSEGVHKEGVKWQNGAKRNGKTKCSEMEWRVIWGYFKTFFCPRQVVHKYTGK